MSNIVHYVRNFATPASGTTVINCTDPFACHFWFSRVTADDTVQAHQEFGHGFAVGSVARALTTNAQDGAGNNRRDSRNANSFLIIDPTDDSDDVLAGLVTFNAGNITIAYTTFTVGYRMHVEIWGGTDGSAEIRETAADASPINDLTMVTADMVLGCTNGELIPAAAQYGYQSYGVAVDNAGIDQWVLYTYMGDNDTDFIGSALVDGEFAGQYDVDFGNWTITITAIGSNGCTWTGTNGDEIAFLFLDLAGDNVHAGTVAKSTATAPATQQLPTFGFTPDGYAIATGHFDLQTINTDRICVNSFGAYSTDGDTQGCALAVGTPQSNADRASTSNDAAILEGSVALQASGVQFTGVAQTIDDATPAIVWDPNTTGGTDDILLGVYGHESQGAPPVLGVAVTHLAFQAFIDSDIDKDADVSSSIALRSQQDYAKAILGIGSTRLSSRPTVDAAKTIQGVGVSRISMRSFVDAVRTFFGVAVSRIAMRSTIADLIAKRAEPTSRIAIKQAVDGDISKTSTATSRASMRPTSDADKSTQGEATSRIAQRPTAEGAKSILGIASTRLSLRALIDAAQTILRIAHSKINMRVLTDALTAKAGIGPARIAMRSTDDAAKAINAESVSRIAIRPTADAAKSILAVAVSRIATRARIEAIAGFVATGVAVTRLALRTLPGTAKSTLSAALVRLAIKSSDEAAKTMTADALSRIALRVLSDHTKDSTGVALASLGVRPIVIGEKAVGVPGVAVTRLGLMALSVSTIAKTGVSLSRIAPRTLPDGSTLRTGDVLVSIPLRPTVDGTKFELVVPGIAKSSISLRLIPSADTAKSGTTLSRLANRIAGDAVAQKVGIAIIRQGIRTFVEAPPAGSRGIVFTVRLSGIIH